MDAGSKEEIWPVVENNADPIAFKTEKWGDSLVWSGGWIYMLCYSETTHVS